MKVQFKPAGEVSKAFMLSDAFLRGLRGPVGSGKSATCCLEIFRRSSQQAPAPDGLRKTRWAVIRNTYNELKTTTIKTWLDWFPEHSFGKFRWETPYTHHVRFGDMDMEVIFLALDRPEDVKKLLSLELTGAFANEARELPKSVIDGMTMRVGRFPSMRDGGPTWYGVILDTNSPEDDHWWPIMAGEVDPPEWMSMDDVMSLQKPDKWEFFTQPPAMNEIRDGKTLLGYEINEQAENIQNLTPDYYPRIIEGKSKNWIDVYVLNRYGSTAEGRQVYPEFNRQIHVVPDLAYESQLPLWIGLDFGLTPAAVIGQRWPDGSWAILAEVVAVNMAARDFARHLQAEASKLFQSSIERGWGDPAGDNRAQTDATTPFQIARDQGLVNLYPAPSNDIAFRTGTVSMLLQEMRRGVPVLRVHPRCSLLVRGFETGYKYRRIQVSGAERYEDKPEKDKHSHIHDALQYLLTGAGEGRRLLNSKTTEARTIIAKHDFSVWDRQKRNKRRESFKVGERGERWV